MKKLTAVASVLALAMSFATAAFANLECIDDCDPPPPPPECITDCEPDKGNNGWGNGIDGDNPGTSKGGTAETKENVPGVDPDKETRFGGR